MCDLGNVPGPTPHATPDGSSLAQRALACEIAGDLDRAVALIRCLQRSAGTGRSAYPGSPVTPVGGGARRIA